MKIFDLTGLLSEGMWDYGEPFVPYAMNRISSFEEDEYIASKIVFTSHTGTHVDCTRHFGEHRPSVEEIDLAKFIGKGKLVDVSAQTVDKVLDFVYSLGLCTKGFTPVRSLFSIGMN